MIIHIHRIIHAISKHIVAQNIIAHNRYSAVRIDKPSHFGVIVAALEIVEACLLIVEISTIAQGVEGSQSHVVVVRDRNGVAPHII